MAALAGAALAEDGDPGSPPPTPAASSGCCAPSRPRSARACSSTACRTATRAAVASRSSACSRPRARRRSPSTGCSRSGPTTWASPTSRSNEASARFSLAVARGAVGGGSRRARRAAHRPLAGGRRRRALREARLRRRALGRGRDAVAVLGAAHGDEPAPARAGRPARCTSAGAVACRRRGLGRAVGLAGAARARRSSRCSSGCAAAAGIEIEVDRLRDAAGSSVAYTAYVCRERINDQTVKSAAASAGVTGGRVAFPGLAARMWIVGVRRVERDPKTLEVQKNTLQQRSVTLASGATERMKFEFTAQVSVALTLADGQGAPAAQVLLAVRELRDAARYAKGATHHARPAAGHATRSRSATRTAPSSCRSSSTPRRRTRASRWTSARREHEVFRGCLKAVQPFVHGDLSTAAAALEAAGQKERGAALRARVHRAKGELRQAAELLEAAGEVKNAAELRASAGDTSAAALFEQTGDWAKAAALHPKARRFAAAARALAKAGDWDGALGAARQSGDRDAALRAARAARLLHRRRAPRARGRRRLRGDQAAPEGAALARELRRGEPAARRAVPEAQRARARARQARRGRAPAGRGQPGSSCASRSREQLESQGRAREGDRGVGDDPQARRQLRRLRREARRATREAPAPRASRPRRAQPPPADRPPRSPSATSCSKRSAAAAWASSTRRATACSAASSR